MPELPRTEVHVLISQEVHFILAENEWFECQDLLVVQIEVTIYPGSGREDIRTYAILPTQTALYKKGEMGARRGPRAYKHPSLTEDEQAQYIAQARAAIEAELKAKA